MASNTPRLYTRLAGLPALKEPQKELVKYYGKLLRALAKLPEDSNYRKATEELVNQKLEIVKSSASPEEVEQKLGQGVCEEHLEQAKLELSLVDKMKSCRPWEPLVEKPPQDQWRWPL